MVRLNAGRRYMSVVRVTRDGRALCAWSPPRGGLECAWFEVQDLRIVPALDADHARWLRAFRAGGDLLELLRRKRRDTASG